jgi:hypothetical protein
VDLSAVEDWIRSYVRPTGAPTVARERPWSTVLRVPVAGGVVWFKACATVQAFEPRLSAQLSARWPDRVAEVLAHDEERAWLLLADAGTPIGLDARPEIWLDVLPRYAELQRGETAYAAGHLTHGVPDLRVLTLPERYGDLLRSPAPEALRTFAPRFSLLCEELAARGVPDTIQHDDLHMTNVYAADGRPRVLDWGDSSIAHPFTSLVVTYRFLEERTGLPPGDPWYARLRDAYLEPWGAEHAETFALAIRVGTFAHAIAWVRQREALPPHERPEHDRWYANILGRALARIDG